MLSYFNSIFATYETVILDPSRKGFTLHAIPSDQATLWHNKIMYNIL